jgi:predicted acyl esterase
VHQPAAPVFAAGGAYTTGAGTVGQVDQREVQDRTDVLCFTGPELALPAEILGSARLVTRVTSDAPSDDVCVTLCEVTSTGAVHNLAFGARRGKGTVTVDLSPVHAVISPGSRLRVAIAPSAYPEIDVNRSAGPLTQVTRVLWPAESQLEVPLVGET